MSENALGNSVRTRLQTLYHWFWGPERSLRVAMVAVVVLSLLIIAITDAVFDGRTISLDKWVVNALRRPDNPSLPIGPRWMIDAARDVTALGGTLILSLVTVIASILLRLQGKKNTGWFVIAIVASGAVLSEVLKAYFGRPRPGFGLPLVSVSSNSFPSGHAQLSALVYLTLGILLANSQPTRVLKIYVICIMAGLSLATGLSRVYLGVHYPTDVLAGWLIGATWGGAAYVMLRIFQRWSHEGETKPEVGFFPENRASSTEV